MAVFKLLGKKYAHIASILGPLSRPRVEIHISQRYGIALNRRIHLFVIITTVSCSVDPCIYSPCLHLQVPVNTCDFKKKLNEHLLF